MRWGQIVQMFYNMKELVGMSSPTKITMTNWSGVTTDTTWLELPLAIIHHNKPAHRKGDTLAKVELIDPIVEDLLSLVFTI